MLAETNRCCHLSVECNIKQVVPYTSLETYRELKHNLARPRSADCVFVCYSPCNTVIITITTGAVKTSITRMLKTISQK